LENALPNPRFSGASLAWAQSRLWRSVLAAGLVTLLGVVVALSLDLWQLQAAFEALPRNPTTVVAMALGYSAAFWLRALAWRALLTTHINTGRLFSILQTSLLLNHALPFKLGEVARPYLATRKGVPAAEAATTTVLARLGDFAALALIAAVAIPLGVIPAAAAVPVAAFGVLCAGAVATLALLRRSVPAFTPPAVRDKVVAVQDALRQVSPRRAAIAAPLVLTSWLLESCVLYGTAHLLGADVGIATAMGATAVTILFQVVQATPGGLGVYEASLTSVLALHGLPAGEALTVALVTHGFKFAYSFSVSLPFALVEGVGALRGGSALPKAASRLEIVAARTWNVFNEGKPFTPVFALAMLLLLSLPHTTDLAYWARFAAALLAMAPLALVFFRFDFPLKLRAALWVHLAVFLLAFRFVDPWAVGLVLTAYLAFTVLMWGTVYYHLRIGTPWTNFLRFWRLVLENPDPTSGNFQEQTPKLLILVLGALYLTRNFEPAPVLGIEAFTAIVALSALLVHQWFFRWVPPLPQTPAPSPPLEGRISRRFIVIAIDGCRADRLLEASTPCIDRLRAEGTDFRDVSTVYPARTVTCFTSMLTGAAPHVHGMHSNFVPRLGVKCDSVFAALRRNGMSGKLVGIAHLIDAFGDDVRSVTAVMDNDDIDDALVAQAKRVMQDEDPDLLVLQLLSVDQTGHARGSYYPEYLRKIEETDRKVEAFLAWCEAQGFLEDATVLITADHGQGIGIGGHGHMSPPEITIPCVLWGAGVEPGTTSDEPRSITDIAPTITHYLGIEAPAHSVGSPLLPASNAEQPVVFVIPARNEADNLGAVLARLAQTAPEGYRAVVVDDGSTDSTAEVAESHGALVLRHERSRGLGAALRAGLRTARQLNARAVVYLDADGEYDSADAAAVLAPIESGEANYVLGRRAGHNDMRPVRRLGNTIFSALLSLACGRRVRDGQTGFRAFSARAVAVAEIVHDYNYAQVLTMDLLRKGMRMAEVPVTYRRRKQGRSFIGLQYLWRVPLGMAREMLAD
jgi:uncharacterized membrane protein YbhN (UPF0104 family)